MIKRLISVLILTSLAIPSYASHRSYGKSGTASGTNSTVTFPWNPQSFEICNDAAAGGQNIFADWSDGVATTTDDSTNVIIAPQECTGFDNPDGNNISNTFVVGLITAAATAAYRIKGIQR